MGINEQCGSALSAMWLSMQERGINAALGMRERCGSGRKRETLMQPWARERGINVVLDAMWLSVQDSNKRGLGTLGARVK